jgi:hypothetical protein
MISSRSFEALRLFQTRFGSDPIKRHQGGNEVGKNTVECVANRVRAAIDDKESRGKKRDRKADKQPANQRYWSVYQTPWLEPNELHER